MKAETEFLITDTRSPEENILRGLFSFFLNTGVADEMLLALDGKLKLRGNGTADVELVVWEETRAVLTPKFLDWIMTNPLAEHFCGGSVGPMLKEKLKSPEYNTPYSPEPFNMMVGQRFKDLTDFDRKRMPKDVQKSFETKARNLMNKWFKEYEETPHLSTVDNPKGYSMDAWFEKALDPKAREYLPYKSLRGLHNLVAKYDRIGEDISAALQKLRDEFQVASVMLS
jgi:hypothetical protein